MQNQSNGTNDEDTIKFVPIPLNPKFPVMDIARQMHSPSSEPISLLHYHDHLEIGYCYEGSGIFIVENKILPFSRGCVSVVFKNEIHIARSDKDNPSKWYFINIDPLMLLNNLNIKETSCLAEFLTNHSNNSNFQNILSPDRYPDLTNLVLYIFNELKNKESGYQTEVKALVWAFIVKLARLNKPEEACQGKKESRDILRVAAAVEYIALKHNTPISIAKLASLCNISISSFRRHFKSSLGISPTEYLYRVRIKMASIFLLECDDSILYISLKVGYTSLSSFNRHFRRIMGISPREWRQEHYHQLF